MVLHAQSQQILVNNGTMINELMEDYYQLRGFNGVTLVAQGDSIVYQKAFGYANFEWEIENTIDTKLRIASITKSFTAILEMQEIEEANLSLDSKVSDYFHSTFFKETSAACFSPYGHKIFFCGDTAKNLSYRNADIWFITKTQDGWSAPKTVSGKINNSNRESQVSIAEDESLYFLSYLYSVRNNYGIYRSRLANGEYQEPEALPEINNSNELDWTPFIAPDESYLLFSSYREGGYGRGDIWISFRENEDNWSTPINLGTTRNEEYNERLPYVSPVGKYLFFLSDKVNPELLSKKELSYKEAEKYYSLPENGQCDIYWVDGKIIEELKLGNFEKYSIVE